MLSISKRLIKSPIKEWGRGWWRWEKVKPSKKRIILNVFAINWRCIKEK